MFRVNKHKMLAGSLLAGAVVYKVLKYYNQRDHTNDVDYVADNSSLVELSTCLRETQVQTVAATETVAPIEDGAEHFQGPQQSPDPALGIIVPYVAVRAPPSEEVNESSQDLRVVGPDGTIHSGTATYVREKTKVTNHRRVLYRCGRKALHTIVAEIKMRMYQPTADRANYLTASKMATDLINKHGIHPRDAAWLHPRVVAHVFIPSNDDIIASDISRSYRAKQRIARMKRGKRSLWGALAAVLGFEPEPDLIGWSPLDWLSSTGVADHAGR